MLIRALTVDTIPELLDSVAGLFAEDGGAHDTELDTGWPQREGYAYYTGLPDDPRGLGLLAWQDERCAGHLVGRLGARNPVRPEARVAVLESIRVQERARGTGVGTALVAEFLRWARDNGATEFRVTAFAGNSGALAFYRRQGFVPFECALRMPAA